MSRCAFFFFLLFCVGLCDVDPFTTLNEEQRVVVGTALSIGLIVLGFVVVFFGQRMARPLISSAGCFILMVITWSVTRMYPGYQSATISLVIRISIVFVAGILGSVIFLIGFKVVVFLFGGILGFFIGAALLAMGAGGSPLFHFLWCFAFGFVGGIISLMWQDILLIIMTAFLGSITIGAGLDQTIFHSGFSTFIFEFIDRVFLLQSSPMVFVLDKAKFWIIFSAVVVLFIFGLIVQYRYTAHYNNSPISATNPSRRDAVDIVEILDDKQA